MNTPLYLGLSILEFSRAFIYEFWYDYVKPKYCETKFDTSNYELERPLPLGKNKIVIELMKDELGRIMMIKFIRLRAKIYFYLNWWR